MTRSSHQTIEDALEADLDSFLTCLEVFIEEHFKPFPPIVEEGYTFPYLIPLVSPHPSITTQTLFLWDIARSEFRHIPDSSLMYAAIGTRPDITFAVTALTGGKGSLTQWVHCEFVVSFEAIRPVITQQVCGEFF